jgi:hypothetical protein
MMAKGKAMVVARPKSRTVQVVQAARRGASKLAEKRKATKGMAIAVVSAGVLGYAESPGADGQPRVKLPKIDALGVPGTYGLLAAGIYAATDSDMAAHIGTGLLSVAIYNAAKAPKKAETVRGAEYVEAAGAVDFE